MNTFPEDLEIGICERCEKQIIFERDDPGADDNPYGLWVEIETGREACTPGTGDTDMYHQPRERN